MVIDFTKSSNQKEEKSYLGGVHFVIFLVYVKLWRYIVSKFYLLKAHKKQKSIQNKNRPEVEITKETWWRWKGYLPNTLDQKKPDAKNHLFWGSFGYQESIAIGFYQPIYLEPINELYIKLFKFSLKYEQF